MDVTDAMLAPFVAEPRAGAVLVDFDGSLAPIVDHPDDARPLPGTAALLGRLSARLARVGVVSGRTVAFLRDALPVDGIDLAGSYGVERLRDGEVVVDPRVAPYREVVAAVAATAQRRLPGVLVERKGEVSVTLHWRRCPERADEVRAVAAELAAAHGLDAPQRGRASVELRPPVPVDKATAVTELVRGCSVACFAGDDAGDLPAFGALERLRDTGRLEHAVRVGVRSSEAPDEVLARADVVVDGPEGLRDWLTALADALDGNFDATAPRA